jgi:hypothetical protein
MIMGFVPEKHKGRLVRTSQFVSNLCPKYVRNIKTYLKIANSIEIQKALKNGRFTMDIYYFLRVTLFRRFLHTVEVRGSSPLSPTIPYSETPSERLPLDCARGWGD